MNSWTNAKYMIPSTAVWGVKEMNLFAKLFHIVVFVIIYYFHFVFEGGGQAQVKLKLDLRFVALS